jgi:NAD(P)H dehydrogenase (quinone)
LLNYVYSIRIPAPAINKLIIMKVLIVFTHPNSNSFNHALLEKITAGLKQSGHEVRVKDLYQENFDPVLNSENLSELHQGTIPSRISKEQEQLLWADGLIFIYPLWWFTPPAMLKGWFDVVLSNGVAFEYSDKGAKGLLKHKKALVMITAGASENYFVENDSLEISYRPITDGTLGFCGVKDVSHQIYYDIVSSTDEERVQILNQAEQFGIDF